MTDCLFCNIANGTIPTESIYADDDVIAFPDINPQAPVHILIIPRQHIGTLLDTSEAHTKLLGKLQQVAVQLARKMKLDESGFRLVTNCLEDGGQAVFHLHLHLLGGRRMSWPPG